jgi:Uma2 family endonuclease/predicted DNA-binding transcriptional regulator AlpA
MLMIGNKELITAQALAEALDLSVETIWRYTREKKIPFIELGSKQYRYNLSDVIEALAHSSTHNSAVQNHAVRENKEEYRTEPAKLTYQDYLLLPEEPGYRYEILEGMLVKEPSPNVPHQRASRRLQRILEDYFWQQDPEGEVFDAPLDVTFQDITVVQPDIFYVSGNQKQIVLKARVDGPPTLVVEVLSPSNSRKDRLQKLQIYQKYGVPHYWLVNPEEKTLECFALKDGTYALVAAGMDEEVVEHPEFEGLAISLKNLW